MIGYILAGVASASFIEIKLYKYIISERLMFRGVELPFLTLILLVLLLLIVFLGLVIIIT
jgi:hypothetical protein